MGDGNVSLNAGNDIDIVAATDTDSTYRFKETKKSGLMGTGGIGVTIGTAKSRYEMNDEGMAQSQSFSTVGSTGGDVSVNAGGLAHIGGADIIAGKDLSIKGDSVLIEPGQDRRTHDESFEQKQSGLTIALSGTAGSAVNSVVTTAQSAQDESDDRMAALKIAQATMSGAQAGQALALDAAKGTDPTNSETIGISASLGTQSSKSTSHSEQNTTTGSTLTAGDNVSITATGGDITAIGSQIKAGADVTLDATKDINLISSQNTQLLEGDNKSSGGAIGIGIGVGSGGAGINISASGNASKGSESGNGTQHNETTIDAGNNVTIRSGDDTTIAGAQVSGNSVVADTRESAKAGVCTGKISIHSSAIRRYPQGNLHHECHRVAEQCYPCRYQKAKGVPDRRLGAKSDLSGDQECFKEMEYADPKLAAGDESLYYRVR